MHENTILLHFIGNKIEKLRQNIDICESFHGRIFHWLIIYFLELYIVYANNIAWQHNVY